MSEVKYNLSPNPVWLCTDENGDTLANGKLWFRKASAHSVEKAVFKARTATPPETEPPAWEQPIVLDAGGHAVDPTSGNIKPIYFASDEDYYLLFEKADTSTYYTEDNFNAPANFVIQREVIVTDNIRNYILNSQFRFFEQAEFKSTDGDLPANTDVAIANSGWTFRRNNEQGVITISFKPFALGQTDVENTPTYYLDFNKTGFGTGGETENDITYAIGNVQDFSGQNLTLGLTGLSTTTSSLSVYVSQFFGTGGSPSATVITPIDILSFDGTWDEKTLLIPIPSVAGKTVGTNNDDKLSLILRAPLNAIGQFSLTNFQLNSGAELQLYDKKTRYDDGIETKAYPLPIPTAQDKYSTLRWDGSQYIFDAETGKISTYMFGEVPDGYLPLDGTTYVRTDKLSGTEIEYDRLYQKFESDAHLSNGNAFGYGEDGFFPLTYPTAGANLVFTNEKRDTAITTWTAGTSGFTVSNLRDGGDKGFTAQFMGEEMFVQDGADDFQIFPPQVLIVENVNVGAVTAATNVNVIPLLLVSAMQVGSASAKNVVSLAFSHDWSDLAGGSHLLISSTVEDYYVWFTKDEVGTDPAVAGRVGIRINTYTRDSITVVLDKLKRALNAISTEFLAYRTNLLTVAGKNVGVVTVASAGTSNAIFLAAKPGTAATKSVSACWFSKAAFMVAGSYCLISSTIADYYVWFPIDGVGTDPAVGGRTGIRVDLNSDDTGVTVAFRVKQALEGTEAHSITNILAASSLSGGEYLLCYNSAVEFYAWYTVDGAGTDPALPGKTGIKIELTSTDSAIDVASKTRKAISSYYFVIPSLEGFFLRAWDNGKFIDQSAEMRYPRGDGSYGDVIGSIQIDANRAHHHGLHSGVWVSGNCDGLFFGAPSGPASIAGKDEPPVGYAEYTNLYPKRPYVSDRGFEARPRNINVLYCIKI